MSGLMSKDEDTQQRRGLRHRRKAKAVGKQLLPTPSPDYSPGQFKEIRFSHWLAAARKSPAVLLSKP